MLGIIKILSRSHQLAYLSVIYRNFSVCIAVNLKTVFITIAYLLPQHKSYFLYSVHTHTNTYAYIPFHNPHSHDVLIICYLVIENKHVTHTLAGHSSHFFLLLYCIRMQICKIINVFECNQVYRSLYSCDSCEHTFNFAVVCSNREYQSKRLFSSFHLILFFPSFSID